MVHGSRHGKEVSIVIPIYNEEGILHASVVDLIDRLQSRPWSYEIILAENGSQDATVEVAEKLMQRFSQLRMIRVGEPNYGKAMRKGIEAAEGRWVICDEIDLCDTDFYERALALLIASPPVEMVIGSKAAVGASDHRPLIRRLATWVINALLRVLLGFKGTDTHGLKAFDRERLLPVVAQCVVDKDLFASEFVVRAQRSGIHIREIPVRVLEKRPPSIHLFRRVPRVLSHLIRLFIVIRWKS